MPPCTNATTCNEQKPLSGLQLTIERVAEIGYITADAREMLRCRTRVEHKGHESSASA